jgi:hypothetical protein
MTIIARVVVVSAALAVILSTLMITITTNGLISLVFAQGSPTITIKLTGITLNLTGSEEVPPVQTNATGMAELFSSIPLGMASIAYSMNATNIEGATAGHIHLGAKGENGPIVVTLFKYDTPMNEVSENGTITADKLEGPMAGKQISELATAGANGTLYVNVHTEQNPNGEIRGQVPPD